MWLPHTQTHRQTGNDNTRWPNLASVKMEYYDLVFTINTFQQTCQHLISEMLNDFGIQHKKCLVNMKFSKFCLICLIYFAYIKQKYWLKGLKWVMIKQNGGGGMTTMTTHCAPACSQILPVKPQAVWARGIEGWGHLTVPKSGVSEVGSLGPSSVMSW